MGKTAPLELTEIAGSTGPLPQRSLEMLQSLHGLVPFDAAWLAVADPMGSSYTCVASTDLDEGTRQYLSWRNSMAHDSPPHEEQWRRKSVRRRLPPQRFPDITTGIEFSSSAVPGLTGQALAPLNTQRASLSLGPSECRWGRPRPLN